MPETCPHCNQTIRKANKPRLIPSADPALMSEAEMRQHYKRTDRLETLKFWIRQTAQYPDIRAALEAFSLSVQNLTIKPADFDRQFEAIKGNWRRQSNAREHQRHIEAGHVLSSGHWMQADPDLPGSLMLATFEQIEGAA